MKNSFLALLCFIVLHSCSINCISAQTIDGSIEHDGLERTYVLYVPSTYDADSPTPLLFNFHGRGSNSSEQMFYGGFINESEENGFLIVHPQGTEGPDGVTFWNADFGAEVDDIGFTAALLDQLSAQYNVDSTRVYSTGMSNGGYMSYSLACAMSEKFAAIASVTGTMTTGLPDDCNTLREVPVMQIHGTADGVVPYEGSQFGTAIDDVIDFWVAQNNCEETPETGTLEDIDPDDGSTVEYYFYETAETGTKVQLYKVIGGGHTWPSAPFVIGSTNKDLNASQAIWEFLSQFTLTFQEEEGTGINEINENKGLSFYPNPTTTYIHLETAQKWEIYSLEGALIKEGNSQKINTQDLKNGSYILVSSNSAERFIKQ